MHLGSWRGTRFEEQIGKEEIKCFVFWDTSMKLVPTQVYIYEEEDEEPEEDTGLGE